MRIPNFSLQTLLFLFTGISLIVGAGIIGTESAFFLSVIPISLVCAMLSREYRLGPIVWGTIAGYVAVVFMTMVAVCIAAFVEHEEDVTDDFALFFLFAGPIHSGPRYGAPTGLACGFVVWAYRALRSRAATKAPDASQ